MSAFLRDGRPGARRPPLWSSQVALRSAALAALLALGCGARSELLPGEEPCGRAEARRACADACGSGEQVCSGGVWQKCEIPPVTRSCSDDCGTGSQLCQQGSWGACEVPLLTVECRDDCGEGSNTCAAGVWDRCRVPDLVRECRSVCGRGEEICTGGKWKLCNAPQPKPPVLMSVVRDFSDQTTPFVQKHPDFELPLSGNFGDKQIVTSQLGADDKPVYGNQEKTTTTSGRANFDQWFRDAPGINQSTSIELQLQKSADEPSLFVYSNDAFFPIDGKLWGNANRAHNFHFTLETSFKFQYVGGEVFRFTGDDDLWVYVNRQLAINLGGIHGSEFGEVVLDQVAAGFGMVKGETYPLHLFFAERHTTESHFAIETSIADPGTCE